MKTDFTDKKKSFCRCFMDRGRMYIAIFGMLVFLGSQTGLRAQGKAFTYQGSLTVAGAPANGQYDLTFGLYATNSGSSPVGTVLTNGNLAAANGLFTTVLDFGPVFDGKAYWLEIGVRVSGSDSDFTILSPRQALNPSPYAVYAVNAGTITGSVPIAALTSVPAGNLTGSVPSGTLISVPAANLIGSIPNGTLPARLQVLNANNAVNLTNITAANLTGTAPDRVLSANIPRLNSNQTFAGVDTFGSGTDSTTNIIEAGNFPFELGNGAWFTTPVPFFRPTTTNTGIALDIMPNGNTADTWLDICSTDDYQTQGALANSEHLHLAKYANGNASISCLAIGGGVVRNLELQEDGGFVGVNTSNPLNEFQVNDGVDVNVSLGVGNASTNARVAAFNDDGSTNIDLEFEASGYHWYNSGPLTQVMGLIGSNLSVLGSLTSTNGFIEQVLTTNGNYTAMLSDSCIFESATANTLITLPTPVGNAGKSFTIKNIGTGTCTITSNAGIDHGTSKTISTQDSSVTLRSDGAVWQIQSVYVGGSNL
jgi:hypothetical protein